MENINVKEIIAKMKSHCHYYYYCFCYEKCNRVRSDVVYPWIQEGP